MGPKGSHEATNDVWTAEANTYGGFAIQRIDSTVPIGFGGGKKHPATVFDP
ncbi:hypothetical protein PMIN06_012996 [Paraphaeosphaeria minitans]